MKKTFIILATTLLSFVFISCNNSANSTNNNSSENTQNVVWYETYETARYVFIVKQGENAEEINSEGYATKVKNHYRLLNGYAIEDIENTTATFVSEDKNKTPYEAKVYVTADIGFYYDETEKKVIMMNIIADNWRWRINEETDHWQCSSPDWNK